MYVAHFFLSATKRVCTGARPRSSISVTARFMSCERVECRVALIILREIASATWAAYVFTERSLNVDMGGGDVISAAWRSSKRVTMVSVTGLRDVWLVPSPASAASFSMVERRLAVFTCPGSGGVGDSATNRCTVGAGCAAASGDTRPESAARFTRASDEAISLRSTSACASSAAAAVDGLGCAAGAPDVLGTGSRYRSHNATTSS